LSLLCNLNNNLRSKSDKRRTLAKLSLPLNLLLLLQILKLCF
jgi:hypothetical protein